MSLANKENSDKIIYLNYLYKRVIHEIVIKINGY